MIKRMLIYLRFNSSVLAIDEEEEKLHAILAEYNSLIVSGAIYMDKPKALVSRDNFTVLAGDIVGMRIVEKTLTPAERIIKLQEKQLGEDEPWKESLRPDEDERDEE
jgi:hypothetical protein